MIGSMSRRAMVRLVSFALALVLLLAGGLVQCKRQLRETKIALETQYLSHLEDLSNHLNALNVALMKSAVTTDKEHFTALSTTLWRESAFAKECLSALPTADLHLEDAARYLTQVGEYTRVLAEESSDGEPRSAEDAKLLTQLQAAANRFTLDILAAEDAVRTHSVSLLPNAFANEDESLSLVDDLQSANDAFAVEEELVYDGPFSEHLYQRTPKMTADLPEISAEEARTRAAEMLRLKPNELAAASDQLGNLPCYCFDSPAGTIALTKKGGLLCTLLRYRSLGEAVHSQQEGIQIARDALQALGIESLAQTFCEQNGARLLVRFVHEENGVLCYPDQLEVTVGLDEGDVLSIDAQGYLMNHHARGELFPVISEEEILQQLSEEFELHACNLAIIPTPGGGEVFCYELRGTVNKQPVYLYQNTKTGKEEDLILLYQDENGIITQ